MKMPFLTPLCLICLQSNINYNSINKEMLTQLLYCLEKTEDFIPPISDQIKMCNDCLNKLNTAFYFKKMCLSNIQIKNYIPQLEQVSNNMGDVKETADLNLEHNFKEKETIFCREETLNTIPFEECGNNKSEKICIDQQLFPCSEETIEKANKADLQKEVMNVCNSLCIKPPTNESEYLFHEQVFVKCEILDENPEDSETQKRYSNEELRMLLHKEEILNDNEEELEKESKKNVEPNHSQEPSDILSNEEDSKKNSCFVCLKTFANKRSLNKHVLIHSKVGRYSCSVCKKTFIRMDSLKRHLLIHERAYSCSICLKSFIQSSALDQHILIHYNERQYSCSVCKKSFSRKDNLKRHMLIHSNERTPSCAICMKSFILNSALTQHMLTHSNKRSYTCSECLKSFTYKSNLKKHIFLIHPKEQSLGGQEKFHPKE